MPNSVPVSESISLPSRVVFLHIAKTAGTSIVQFFRDRMPPESICSHGDFLQLSGTQAQRIDQLQKFQFLSGHFGYSDVQTLLDDSYSFTFLRDPVERILSLYKFFLWPNAIKLIPAARIAMDLGLEGFLTSNLPEVSEVLDNQQTWQLARSYWQEDRQALRHLPDDELLGMAIEHLGAFDLVGNTETFDADFGHVLHHLGIDQAVPETREFKTRTPASASELSPSTLERLQERNALDYALVAHVEAIRAGGG